MWRDDLSSLSKKTCDEIVDVKMKVWTMLKIVKNYEYRHERTNLVNKTNNINVDMRC